MLGVLMKSVGTDLLVRQIRQLRYVLKVQTQAPKRNPIRKPIKCITNCVKRVVECADETSKSQTSHWAICTPPMHSKQQVATLRGAYGRNSP